jgi:hypothetical protein
LELLDTSKFSAVQTENIDQSENEEAKELKVVLGGRISAIRSVVNTLITQDVDFLSKNWDNLKSKHTAFLKNILTLVSN